jgi:MFS family permease
MVKKLSSLWGHIDYKWIVLSNTTLGVFMAFLDASIVLIALPSIFNGIKVNPLAPGETNYLLWTLMGYLVVTSTLLVTFGRISDMFGRVRLYNLGFAIFAVGSILLYLVPGTGNTAALLIIIYRLIQAVGGAFLISNSTAILTDAFPPNQRGFAMGINMIAGTLGSFIGVVVGGVLASINWRYVFLVSVPFSVGGTIWAYLGLRELATIRQHQRLDITGNILFALGLTALLVGATYGIQPYGGAPMGWGNPFVQACLIGGTLALIAFVFVEQRVPDPMFRLKLFKARTFSTGNIAGFLASLARGGLNLILVIWLQGIWLPLHGVSYVDTPLWAGIYMLPLTFGFMVMGPISGTLSDRWGARALTSAGLLLTALGFAGLLLIPVNFAYWTFALAILVIGLGMGLFVSPNLTAIMNSVPAEHRGASSGMRSTVANSANTVSITWIFAIVTLGLASHLPSALYQGLTQAGVPSNIAQQVSRLPPTGAMFAAFLGYDPIKTMLPSSVVQQLPASSQALLFSKTFFPNLISAPFDDGLRIAFLISIALSVVGAIASSLSGRRFIYEQEYQPQLNVNPAAGPPDPVDQHEAEVPCGDEWSRNGKFTAHAEKPC